MATYHDFRMTDEGTETVYEQVDEVTRLESFEAVVDYLRGIYDRNALEAAEANAERPEHEREDLSTFGGFAADLENAFGSVVEFALGRRIALMIKHKPEPLEIYRKPCTEPGRYIDFWLAYSNHTQLAENELPSRDEGLRLLREWLEHDTFPQGCVTR